MLLTQRTLRKHRACELRANGWQLCNWQVSDSVPSLTCMCFRSLSHARMFPNVNGWHVCDYT